MRQIGKALAIAATAAMLGGAGMAIAQTGGPGGGGYGMMAYGPGGGGPGWMDGGAGYGPGRMMGGDGGGPGWMQGGGGPGWMQGGYGPGFRHGWGGPGSFAGDPAARLAALKAELNLRPDQQAAWDEYAKAMQDGASQMQALYRSIDPATLPGMDWQQHQAFMAKLVDQRAATFKSVQAAGGKLMAALDDTQKARLLQGGPGYGGPGRFGGNGGVPCPGFGYGMMGWGPGGGWR